MRRTHCRTGEEYGNCRWPPPPPFRPRGGDTSKLRSWERWGLDIRSDVESVTRFSVIESKISLKNERRSRCISALLSAAGKESGNARETRCRSRLARVKMDLPTESRRAAGIRYRLYTLHSASPVVNVKRIKYFLAADGPGEFQCNDGAGHIRGFRSRIKINRTPIGTEWLHARVCAFTPVTPCVRPCVYMRARIRPEIIVTIDRTDTRTYTQEGFQMTVGKVGFSRLHAGLSSSPRRDVGSRGFNVFTVPFSDN